jgi:ribosomal protein S1
VDFTQEQWDALRTRYPPGTPVSGTVVACPPFGAFVRLDELPDVPALLEFVHFGLCEAGLGRRIRYPADYPPVGSRVEARVLLWSRKPGDVRLTRLSHLDWSHLRWLAEKGTEPAEPPPARRDR